MRTMETATICDDLIASYSSKGPSFIDHSVKPDIVAPGNLVSGLEFSSDPLAVNNPDFYTLYSFYETKGSDSPSSNYFAMSGTSMAAGVASGAVADLLQAAPGLTPDKVKALLMVNADRSYFPATSSVVADGVDLQRKLRCVYGWRRLSGHCRDSERCPGEQRIGADRNGHVADCDLQRHDRQRNRSDRSERTVDRRAVRGRHRAVYGSSAFMSGEKLTSTVVGPNRARGARRPFGGRQHFGDSAIPTGSPHCGARPALWGQSSPQAETALVGPDSSVGPNRVCGVSQEARLLP